MRWVGFWNLLFNIRLALYAHDTLRLLLEELGGWRRSCWYSLRCLFLNLSLWYNHLLTLLLHFLSFFYVFKSASFRNFRNKERWVVIGLLLLTVITFSYFLRFVDDLLRPDWRCLNWFFGFERRWKTTFFALCWAYNYWLLIWFTEFSLTKNFASHFFVLFVDLSRSDFFLGLWFLVYPDWARLNRGLLGCHVNVYLPTSASSAASTPACKLLILNEISIL